jgi:hypothetical protein
MSETPGARTSLSRNCVSRFMVSSIFISNVTPYFPWWTYVSFFSVTTSLYDRFQMRVSFISNQCCVHRRLYYAKLYLNYTYLTIISSFVLWPHNVHLANDVRNRSAHVVATRTGHHVNPFFGLHT